MPLPLNIIFLPFFVLFCFSILRLYYLEMKIMRRLKIIDPDEWQRLIWWFGARAHPFRFRKFIKEGKTSDNDLQNHIKQYQKTFRYALIIWAISAIILLSFTVLGIFLNYTN